MRLLDFLSSLSHVPLDQFILWLSLRQLRDLSSDGSDAKHHNRVVISRRNNWEHVHYSGHVLLTNLKSPVTFSLTESVQSQRLVTNMSTVLEVLVVQFIHIPQFTRWCNVVGTYQKLTSVALQGAIHVRRTLCFWTSVALVAQSCIVHNKALIFFGFSRKLTKPLYLHLHYNKLLPSSPQLTQVERKCPQVYDRELSSNKQRLRILWTFSPFPTTPVELFQHDKMTQTIFNSIHVSLKSLWIHYKPTLQ